jgi:hypothetical protein
LVVGLFDATVVPVGGFEVVFEEGVVEIDEAGGELVLEVVDLVAAG